MVSRIVPHWYRYHALFTSTAKVAPGKRERLTPERPSSTNDVYSRYRPDFATSARSTSAARSFQTGSA
jgi:hypothetical protein